MYISSLDLYMFLIRLNFTVAFVKVADENAAAILAIGETKYKCFHGENKIL